MPRRPTRPSGTAGTSSPASAWRFAPLACVAKVPLVGLDSLEVIAQNAPAEAPRVSVIADAQRGDVYSADFRRDEPSGPLLRTSPTRIEPLAEWSARLEGPVVMYVLGP